MVSCFFGQKIGLNFIFFLSTKTTNVNSKKIQIFQRTKKFKKFFFWRLNSYLYIYIDYYKFIWEVLWLNFPKCDQNKKLNSVAGLRLAAIFIFYCVFELISMSWIRIIFYIFCSYSRSLRSWIRPFVEKSVLIWTEY